MNYQKNKKIEIKKKKPGKRCREKKSIQMKRDIVTDKEIQNTELVREFKMNNVFNNHHKLQFYKIELNQFSYYFHTC